MDSLTVSGIRGEVSFTVNLKKFLAFGPNNASPNGMECSFLDQLVSIASIIKDIFPS